MGDQYAVNNAEDVPVIFPLFINGIQKNKIYYQKLMTGKINPSAVLAVLCICVAWR